MKSTLPATHLIRQFLLFVFTVLFFLTMVRAGLALWQYPQMEEADSIVTLFVLGLRFDMALLGIVCLVPVVLGSLLAMTNATRSVAKLVIGFFLSIALLFIVLLEVITPWFLHTHGMRPDLASLVAVQEPMDTIRTVFTEQLPAAVIVLIIGVLILIAYWSRMELSRFLRYRVSMPAAILTALLGGILCILAVWSTPDFLKGPLSPADATVGSNEVVNEIALNSSYSTLHSFVSPYLERVSGSLSKVLSE